MYRREAPSRTFAVRGDYASSMKRVRVLKFGGAALKDGEAVRRAAEVVREHGGPAPLVVVSAHAGVTEQLSRAAEEAAEGKLATEELRVRHRTLLRQLGLPAELLDRHLTQLFTVLRGVCEERRLDRRRRDFVLSFGERMSARVVAAALRDQGAPATPVDAFDLGLMSETRAGFTLPQESTRERVREAVMDVPGIPVVTGFIALDAEGHVTTLGPNGSDLTAVWLAGAVGAEEVHLWKTVSGVCTADPDLVPRARRIDQLSYLAAAELALHGARVLHPAAMEPARRHELTIQVRSALEPRAGGTKIGPFDGAPGGNRLALAHRRGVALLTQRLDLSRAVEAQVAGLRAGCSSAGLEPYLYAVPGAEVVMLLPDPPEGADETLRDLAQGATLERGLASFALVGEGAGDDPTLVSRVAEVLRGEDLIARSLPAGDGPLSRLFLVAADQLGDALRAVHSGMIEGQASSGRTSP